MLYFIVPAYNEEANIGSLLDNVCARLNALKEDYRIVVVDDGSADRTAEVVQSFAQRLPVQLVRHGQNRGPGRAFDTGFRAVLEAATDEDLIVTQEADNTSDPAILDRMIREARAGADVVLASCYAPGGGIEGTTATRVALSAVANFLLRAAFPLGVATYSSFYRVYRAGVIRAAYRRYAESLITESGFVCMVELLVKLGRMGVTLREVPMRLRCQARRGQSKMRILRTIRSYLSLILRYRLLRQLPPPLPAAPARPAVFGAPTLR
jgi:dolichol-phosphate mannosyltransferase